MVFNRFLFEYRLLTASPTLEIRFSVRPATALWHNCLDSYYFSLWSADVFSIRIAFFKSSLRLSWKGYFNDYGSDTVTIYVSLYGNLSKSLKLDYHFARHYVSVINNKTQGHRVLLYI